MEANLKSLDGEIVVCVLCSIVLWLNPEPLTPFPPPARFPQVRTFETAPITTHGMAAFPWVAGSKLDFDNKPVVTSCTRPSKETMRLVLHSSHPSASLPEKRFGSTTEDQAPPITRGELRSGELQLELRNCTSSEESADMKRRRHDWF